MRALFFAHSGLRYLVLLMGLVAVAYFAFGLVTRRPVDRSVRIIGSSYIGFLDLQILLGIILLTQWSFYPALWGHLVLMLLAATVAHVLLAINRRRPNPNWALPLAGVGLSLLFVIGGILAIGRSLFGTTGLGG
jgi:hypothetical protein